MCVESQRIVLISEVQFSVLCSSKIYYVLHPAHHRKVKNHLVGWNKMYRKSRRTSDLKSTIGLIIKWNTIFKLEKYYTSIGIVSRKCESFSLQFSFFVRLFCLYTYRFKKSTKICQKVGKFTRCSCSITINFKSENLLNLMK